MIYPPAHSPLFMAMDDPVLNKFVSYLAEKKEEQASDPSTAITIEFRRPFIDDVRESFRQKILDGERHLHLLSHILASVVFCGEFELHSNVIGMLPGDEERPFLIRERISPDTLFTIMDIDLGNQMLDNFRYRQGQNWVPLQLAANFIEYLPISRTTNGVNRLTSRVKAEEELWNKVADELFHLDVLVSRDKHLRQYSKYVKDIFGVKIVCDDESVCFRVHEQLQQLTLSSLPDHFATSSRQLEAGSSEKFLEFVETKDYLTCSASEMKKTGWKALKSVVMWNNRLFEIQVQPLGNYYLEIDHMAGPSHHSFKQQRDSMREDVAARVPLYGFYRKMLRMLFKESDVSFECDHASVLITD